MTQELITPEEAETLTKARHILNAIEDRCGGTYFLGRCGEACDRAEDAIFEALNNLLHYGEQEFLRHDIDSFYDRKEATA